MRPLSCTVVALVAVWVSACVSVAPNRLSASETADLKFTSLEVQVAETAQISWTAAEDSYLQSRGLSQTDPALVRTPEARAHVNGMAAQRLKSALERVTAERAAGTHPVRREARIVSVHIPSAAERIIAGGAPRISADIDIVDAKTGRVLTSYTGALGTQIAGQGIGGVIVDAALVSGGMNDLFDRAAESYAKGFVAWLARA